jgi:hypothetical protein
MADADHRKDALAILDYTRLFRSHGFAVMVAAYGPPSRERSGPRFVERIAIGLDEQAPSVLAGHVLAYEEMGGRKVQRRLSELRSLGGDKFGLVLDKIRAVPTSIRIQPQFAIDRAVSLCGSQLGPGEPAHFGFAATQDTVSCFGRRLLASGWSEPEPSGVWSQKKEARLVLPLESAQGEYEAVFDVVSYVTFGLHPGPQTVQVSIQGKPAATWIFGKGLPAPDTRVPIPLELDKTHKLEFKFLIEPTLNPKRLAMSQDSRDLGIFLRSVVIRPGAR